MPRRPLFETSEFPYHVTSRSNNKEWFYIPIRQCWEIFCEKMSQTSEKFGSQFFALVLMSNHFHLILDTPDSNLGDVMRHLLTEISKAVQRSSGRQNHVFGGRYRWSILDSAYSYAYVTKYLFRNPIRAGMVARAQEYPFSSLSIHPGVNYPPVTERIDQISRLVPKDREERLAWLNSPVGQRFELVLRRALKNERFKLPNSNGCRADLKNLREGYGVEKPGDAYLVS